MPIIVSDETIGRRGLKDARRHREKKKDELKKRIPDLIADEEIITRGRHGGKIRVRIRSLQNERFREQKARDEDSLGGGIGQGDGDQGEEIGRRPGEGEGQGAGSAPGEDEIDTEIDFEEIIEWMLQDTGLPNLEEKTIKELEVQFGFKIEGISRSGPWSFLHLKKTGKEGFKRFYSFLYQVVSEIEELARNNPAQKAYGELECFDALKRAQGDLQKAVEILSDPAFECQEKEITPFHIFYNEDLRFRKVEPDIQHQSNAVAIFMMDVSGSMTTEKKFLVRSLGFWLAEFLWVMYDNLEIRFIVHHSTARFVLEEEFFKTRESGGTVCASAYELARMELETKYPAEQWNRYVFHFSDGDDWTPGATIEEVKKLIEAKVQMLAYGEVDVGGEYRDNENTLFEHFKKELPVADISKHTGDAKVKNSDPNTEELNVLSGSSEFPLLAVVIRGKEDLLPTVKQFLHKWRWQNE